MTPYAYIPPVWRVIQTDRYTQDEQIICETRDYHKAVECVNEVQSDPFNKDRRYTAYIEKYDF